MIEARRVRQTENGYITGILRCSNFGVYPSTALENPKSSRGALFLEPSPLGPGSVILPTANCWLMFWLPCQRRKIRTLNIRSRSWNYHRRLRHPTSSMRMRGFRAEAWTLRRTARRWPTRSGKTALTIFGYNPSTARVADRSHRLMLSRFSTFVGHRTAEASAYSAVIPTPTLSSSANCSLRSRNLIYTLILYQL